jgi:hypothetical protein
MTNAAIFMSSLILCQTFLSTIVSAQNNKSIRAYSSGSLLQIDGFLNDPDWKNAEVISEFTQRELSEGEPATEKTEVRILYDTQNIYIGVI